MAGGNVAFPLGALTKAPWLPGTGTEVFADAFAKAIVTNVLLALPK
jgi:hypothetical protein